MDEQQIARIAGNRGMNNFSFLIRNIFSFLSAIV